MIKYLSNMVEKTSIIREQRKTVKICINKQGEITVYCPLKLPLSKIDDILRDKEQLLERKILKIKALSSKFSKIISKENILLFGKEYIIVPTTKVSKPAFTEEYFLLPKKYNTQDKVNFCIKKTIKNIADNVLTKRISDILACYKFDVSKVIIGSYRAKWGSCDKFGVIKLNWRLACVSPNLIDFVIYHELTHLKELNHSQKFYQELEKICPAYKKNRAELNNYSFLLELY